MRAAAALTLVLVGCGGAREPAGRAPVAAAADVAPPLPAEVTYARSQLAAARADAARAASIATRRWRAALEAGAAEPWLLGTAATIAHGRLALLDTCAATGDGCPPALVATGPAPAVEAEVEVGELAALDGAGWQARAAHARAEACACATVACVDGWTEELRRLEVAVPAAAQGEPVAAAHVVAARACLATLRRGPPLAHHAR